MTLNEDSNPLPPQKENAVKYRLPLGYPVTISFCLIS